MSKSSLVVKTKTAKVAAIIIILLLPDDFFSIGSIYYSGTPSSIAYNWLSYNFNVIQLVILLAGIIGLILSKNRFMLGLAGYFITREILILMIQSDSIFKSGRYEVYLSLFVGVSLIVLTLRMTKTNMEALQCYKGFLVSNMLTVFVMAVRGGGSGLLAGRCNASNLDVGSTGVLCVILIIFLCETPMSKSNYILLALTFVALFLSGSRTNMALGILFLILIFITVWYERRGHLWISVNQLIVAIVIVTVGISVIAIKSDEILESILDSRFGTLLNTSAIKADDSIVGRTASITAGLDILLKNPIGISGFFINLQRETIARGYGTFPHSGILSEYLLLGPIVLFLYYIWLKAVAKLMHIERRLAWAMLFFAVYNIFAGGPIVNFKIIYMYGMPTALSYIMLKRSRKQKAARPFCA